MKIESREWLPNLPPEIATPTRETPMRVVPVLINFVVWADTDEEAVSDVYDMLGQPLDVLDLILQDYPSFMALEVDDIDEPPLGYVHE